MQKTRILFVVGGFVHGGIESYILNILDHIDREHYLFEIAIAGMFKHANENALIERGVKVMHYSSTPCLKQIQQIRLILRNGNYDIIHIMNTYVTLEGPAVFALVAIAERKYNHYKVICHAHGTEDTSKPTPHIIKRKLRNLYRRLIRIYLNKADYLAACSKEAGNFMYGNNAEVSIQYNGINLERFSLKANDCLYTKYGINKNMLKFVTVARMAVEKNPIFTLDVITYLKDYYPELQFIWVGDGLLMDTIKEYIAENDISQYVNLLGNQNHVEEILKCCDYFLLPSIREGLGMVFIEAQVAGLQCFSSDRVPNIVDCGGVSFISLEKTAKQWADEIHQYIQSKPQRLIHMELLKQYDINETAKVLGQVYDNLKNSGC